MAPKGRGSKRVASQTTASAAKRQETANPHVDAVEAGINKATDLPEPCRKMLLATLPTCFSDPSNSIQAAFVRMTGDALRSVEANLEEAVKAEDAKVATIHASKEQLDKQAADADATLSEAKKTVEIKQAALKAAAKASLTADESLSQALSAQRAGEEELEEAGRFKESVCKAIDVDLAAVLAAESEEKDCVHYKALLPILKRLDIDSTLSAALPAACMKSITERGDFDKMVIDQFAQVLREKKSSLEQLINNGSESSKARAAAVDAAHATVASAKESVTQATREVQETQGLEGTASLAADEAHNEVKRFEPECRQAAEGRDAAASVLGQFQQHSLQSFKALQEVADEAKVDTVPELIAESVQVADEPKVVAVPEVTAGTINVGGA